MVIVIVGFNKEVVHLTSLFRNYRELLMKMSVEIPPLMRQSLSSLCVVLFCFVFSLPFMKSEGAAPAETDAKIGPIYIPLAVYGVEHLQFGAFRVIERRSETVVEINALGEELPYKAKNHNGLNKSAIKAGKFVIEGQWARGITVELKVRDELPGYDFRIGDGLIAAIEGDSTTDIMGNEIALPPYEPGVGGFNGGFLVDSAVIDKMTQLPSTFTIHLPGIDSPSPGTLAFSFGGTLTIEDSTTLPPPSEDLAKVTVTIIYN